MSRIGACKRKQHDPCDFNNSNDMLDHTTLLTNRAHATVKKGFCQRCRDEQGNNGNHTTPDESQLKPVGNITRLNRRRITGGIN